MVAGAAPAAACGFNPCAPVAPIAPIVTGCNTGCGGWGYGGGYSAGYGVGYGYGERLAEPATQYYYANPGPDLHRSGCVRAVSDLSRTQSWRPSTTAMAPVTVPAMATVPATAIAPPLHPMPVRIVRLFYRPYRYGYGPRVGYLPRVGYGYGPRVGYGARYGYARTLRLRCARWLRWRIVTAMATAGAPLLIS